MEFGLANNLNSINTHINISYNVEFEDFCRRPFLPGDCGCSRSGEMENVTVLCYKLHGISRNLTKII